LIRPFEKIKEQRFKNILNSLFFFILIIIASFGISDDHKSFNDKYREKLGWLMIIILLLDVVFHFTINSY